MSGNPLTISEVAQICGVDETTVQAWINAKLIRVSRDPITGAVRVHRNSLAYFLLKKNYPWHVVHKVLRNKFFTTGQIAWICGVAPGTVRTWIDKGFLKGFRIPGGLDRRVPREELARFLKERGVPLGDLERELHRHVLFVGGRKIFVEAQRFFQKRENYVCEFEFNVLDAAFKISERKCLVVVVDLDEIGKKEALELVSVTRRHTGSALWIIALIDVDEADTEFLRTSSFSDVIQKPVDIGVLVTKVCEVLERL